MPDRPHEHDQRDDDATQAISMPENAPTIAGRYELGPVIGRGGHADVHVATDRTLGRQVAVKIMRDVSVGETERHRFTSEARTLALLNHPHLVTVLDAGTADATDGVGEGHPYLVMEYVDGISLAETAGSRLHPTRVAALATQLSAALAHAHAAGVVHRDVKPANVLLGKDGRARLTDFGIARLVGDTTSVTQAGTTVGTAAYLSPEQVKGETTTPATDIYSLGLLLLEALTGTRAYPGSATESAMARLHRQPEIPADVPEPWADLVGTMVQQRPEDRPDAEGVHRTATALAAGLDPAEATQAIRLGQGAMAAAASDEDPTSTRVMPATAPAPEPTRSEPVRSVAPAPAPASSGRSRKWVAPLLALAVLAGLVVAGILLLGGPPGPPDGVPAELRSELQDLHDAANGESR
ncbi:MAG: protein kinase [Nocardioides sp.]|nr:protein kinase [Nocardioides sp.]